MGPVSCGNAAGNELRKRAGKSGRRTNQGRGQVKARALFVAGAIGAAPCLAGPPSHASQGRPPHHVTRPLRMRDSFARGKGIRITQSEGPRPPAASPPAASRLDGWAPALLGRSGWPPQQRYAARKSRRSSHLPGRTPRASRSRRSPRSRQPRYRKPSSCRSSCPSTRTRWVPRSR